MKFRKILDVYNSGPYKILIFFGIRLRLRSKYLILRDKLNRREQENKLLKQRIDELSKVMIQLQNHVDSDMEALKHMISNLSDSVERTVQSIDYKINENKADICSHLVSTEVHVKKLEEKSQNLNDGLAYYQQFTDAVAKRIGALELLRLGEFNEKIRTEINSIEENIRNVKQLAESSYKKDAELLSARLVKIENIKIEEKLSKNAQAIQMIEACFDKKFQEQGVTLQFEIKKQITPIRKKIELVACDLAEQSELRTSLRKRMVQTSHLGERFNGWPQQYQNSVLKQYLTLDFEKRNRNRVIVYMTNNNTNCGLADRLRTILTAYVIAAESNREFYIYHDSGFKMEEYLQPNVINWKIEKKDIACGLNNVYSIFLMRKFEDLSTCHRECHVYQSNTDIDTDFLPAELEGKYSNHDVFHNLFKVAPKVRDAVRLALREQSLRKNGYVAVHIRFLNFFEQVEWGGSITSTEEQREQMLRKIHMTLDKLHKETKKKILLLSDTNRVLQESYPKYVKTLKGNVGHIARHRGNEEIVLKGFVDLLAISQASAVYSIIGENIYEATESRYGGQRNGFSKTGAYIGNVPFIRYNIVDD